MRYRTRRNKLINLLGSKCVECGTTETLEFDHVDAATKIFTISSNMFRPWAALLAEVMKCQLLCRPCHVDKTRVNGEHAGGHNRIEEHGTEAFFKRTGCHCEACVAARHEARIRRGEVSGDNAYSNIYGGRGRYGTVGHGEGKTGKSGCKCKLCLARKAEYARNRKQARAVSSKVRVPGLHPGDESSSLSLPTQ